MSDFIDEDVFVKYFMVMDDLIAWLKKALLENQKLLEGKT
jgi:hypothetical protein